jgi:hypothetical protein
LQILTKEVDWRVAKAYVAIADDPDEAVEFVGKLKESGGRCTQVAAGSSLEVMAVGRYLDDEEWEQEQLREGRRIEIQGVPNVSGKDETTRKGEEVSVRTWFRGRMW